HGKAFVAARQALNKIAPGVQGAGGGGLEAHPRAATQGTVVGPQAGDEGCQGHLRVCPVGVRLAADEAVPKSADIFFHSSDSLAVTAAPSGLPPFFAGQAGVAAGGGQPAARAALCFSVASPATKKLAK